MQNYLLKTYAKNYLLFFSTSCTLRTLDGAGGPKVFTFMAASVANPTRIETGFNGFSVMAKMVLINFKKFQALRIAAWAFLGKS